MYCRNCGTALKNGALFCHNCGSEVKKAEPVAANENVVINPEVTQQSPNINPAPNPNVSAFAQPMPVKEDKKDNSGFAIASLVLGLVSLLPLCCVNFITAILGFIFGLISLKSSKKGMAIAGVILSIVAVIIALVTISSYIIGITNSVTAYPEIFDYFEYFLEDGAMYY